LISLYWICAERAYAATTGEVFAAYAQMLPAADFARCAEAVMEQLRILLESFPQERSVGGALAHVLAIKSSLSVSQR
jgi:hypothetical protein